MQVLRRNQQRPKAPEGSQTDQYRVIADLGPTLLSYVDSECRHAWINKACEKWFGRTAEEVRGMHLRDFLGVEAWRKAKPNAVRALAGEAVTFDQEVVRRGRNGVRRLRTTYTPDFDNRGRVRGFAVHAVDLGNRSTSEESLLSEKSFSESAINSMPGVFYLFTKEGRFIRWNRNLEEVSGYSFQEISSMSPLDFFDCEGKKTIGNAMNRVFADGSTRVEANLLAKDGKSIPYLFTGRRMLVADVPCVIGSGIDMSGRKEAEAAQRATLNLLEDFDQERRNFQLVQKATLNLLEDMHAERSRLDLTQRALMNILEDIETERIKVEHSKLLLEATNKELEAFSYSVSHDLRAPLRAISGFAQAVEEDYASRLDGEGKRYLGLIQENAHKMGKLIDDLLTFSRLGRQHVKRTDIDMEYLVRTIFSELAQQVSGRHIEFKARRLPPARGDEAMIQQVLANLIGNAIKFTRDRKDAWIELGFLPELEGGAYYVRDNGVGFDMKYVDKLFGVFQRLHSASEFEGTGVGLALVHRIITRHGGNVWAESRVDEGATFYFTLPKETMSEKRRN